MTRRAAKTSRRKVYNRKTAFEIIDEAGEKALTPSHPQPDLIYHYTNAVGLHGRFAIEHKQS